MTLNGWIQIALFSVIIIALARPRGGYMTRVFAGERTSQGKDACRSAKCLVTGSLADAATMGLAVGAWTTVARRTTRVANTTAHLERLALIIWICR